MLKQAPLIYTISLALVFSPTSRAAGIAGSAAERSSVRYTLQQNGLDRMTSFMRDIRAALDRSSFDFDSLLESLDYDAAKIIDFSRRAISFEQYDGVLRGPRGTLFSRFGNAIDQALLTAKLLRDAGYDARIASAVLNRTDAGLLLRAMAQPVLPAPPIGDADAILEVLKRHKLVDPAIAQGQISAFRSYVENAPDAASASVYAQVASTAEELRKRVDQRGVRLGSATLDAAVIEEARRYYWVQYRDEGDPAWIDVHPVFSGTIPFEQPAPTGFIADNVPAELMHRVRFQVFIERKTGGRLEVVPVTAPWERPVANLVGTTLTFSNLANSMLRVDSAGSSLDAYLDAAGSFVPTFNNGMADGAQFFDLHGRLIDPMAAGASSADLFATIGNAFGEASGRIGDKSSLPTLTAQWLEFVLISPDGREQTYRRTTFDRIGAAARESGRPPETLAPTTIEDVRSLLQQHSFLVGSGKIPRAFGVDYAIDYFEKSRPRFDATLDLRYQRPSRARSLSNVPVGWPGHLALLALFDQADTLGPNHRSYRSGPALVIHSEGLARGEGFAETIDVVSNPRRVFDIGAEIPKLDPFYALQAGIWETAVEGSFLARDGRFNTWAAVNAAKETGIDPIVLLPSDQALAIDATPDTIAAIKSDLARGFAVVAPSREFAANRSGWWRIDPLSGETLGQIDDGRGSDTTEFLIGLGLSLGFLAYGGFQCATSAGPEGQLQTGQLTDEEMCCHAMNGGMAFATAMIGIFLLPLSGGAAIGAGGIMDFASAIQPFTEQICEELTEDDPWD